MVEIQGIKYNPCWISQLSKVDESCSGVKEYSVIIHFFSGKKIKETYESATLRNEEYARIKLAVNSTTTTT